MLLSIDPKITTVQSWQQLVSSSFASRKTAMQSERNILQQVAQELKLREQQVESVVQLLDEGNTIPFITRYRKHLTGGLDETILRQIESRVSELREMAIQTERMLKAIEDQGKLTPELKALFAAADSRKRLDELFAPFKSRRKTRADEALERGLGPLAEAIWTGRIGDGDLEKVASNCIGKHPDLTDMETVLSGAADIIAARIGESVPIRDAIREVSHKTGRITTKLVKNAPDAQIFQDYAAFESNFNRLPPHRILAIDRGEAKKAIRIGLSWDDERAAIRAAGILRLGSHRAQMFLKKCLEDAQKRLINPAIEREIRRELTERAQTHAIEVFGKNLRSLLMQPPLKRQRVLAIDPGFRTGCKVVVLGEEGNVLANDLIYVIGQGDGTSQQVKLAQLVETHAVDVIAIGNGTASRETEELVAKTIEARNLKCQYVIVNEAGASIYSASEVGRQEFPDLDATIRGTISIGRRLQDPLSELVKIEPQHIGVGMYQHDLAEKQLQSSLDMVVESCVNQVGVDLNRSSVELLKYVSGLNRTSARKIVEWRNTHGAFHSRAELKKVAGIGEVTFTQAAGFLRIVDGDNPLDSTWIHPESYSTAKALLKHFGVHAETLKEGRLPAEVRRKIASISADDIARTVQIDRYTADDLLQSLLRPGRDPREDVSGPLFRSGVLKFEDLREGMNLQGVVSNVVDFGAFVDVGLKNDGLIHISKMADTFVASPFDHVSVGDIVVVWVDHIDVDRKRVGLSLLKPNS